MPNSLALGKNRTPQVDRCSRPTNRRLQVRLGRLFALDRSIYGTPTGYCCTMRSRVRNGSLKAISFELYSLVCFSSLIFQLTLARYFEFPNLGGLFEVVSDLPSTVGGDDFQPVIGKHFFGDLLDGHENFPKLPSGAYFGASYLFYWLTSGVSYKIVFVVFFALAILMCAFSLRRWLSIVSKENKGMVYALHFSYPFVFAADRGQMSLLTGYLLAIGLSYLVTQESSTKRVSLGQAILGAAFSMKIYPVFIAFAFEKIWSFKQWRALLISFFVFICSTPLIFAFFGGSLSALDSSGELYVQDGYFVRTLERNTSLKSLFFHFQRIEIEPISTIFGTLFQSYSVLYVFYALFLAVLLKSKFLQRQEQLLALSILSISIVPIAPVYSQTLVCAVALVSLTEVTVGSKMRQYLYWLVIVVTTLPLNIPLIPERNRGPELYSQSFLTPLVQHLYVVILGALVVVRYGKKKLSDSVVLYDAK